jgi:3-methyl-2-oxobutanoate hydroxymethyltransferase
MRGERITSANLAAMKARGERIACLTCYDAAFCRVLERAEVDVLLVGDSLGNVIQGQATTVPVSVADMAYHSACVARARERALLVADMPFLSYATPERALATAGRLMQEGGAQMVKLEGGGPLAETVRLLTSQGVAVCGHLGLLPQSVMPTRLLDGAECWQMSQVSRRHGACRQKGRGPRAKGVRLGPWPLALGSMRRRAGCARRGAVPWSV